MRDRPSLSTFAAIRPTTTAHADQAIPLGTLENQEQGRRRPEGPARVLLALIDKRPSIVQDELGR